MLTVSELLKRSILKRYTVSCGFNGLDNQVLKSGIIDYEFSIDGFIETNDSFQYGDFLISSLLFTKGDEEKFLDMVIKLVELGVSGVAIKDVFFKTIPDNVVDYCNKHGFPIILFDNQIYFEDIINEIDNLLKLSDWISKVEQQISLMLNTELSRYEVEGISREIGFTQLDFVRAYCLKPKQGISQSKIKKIVEDYSESRFRSKSNIILKYKQNFIILVSLNEKIEEKFQEQFNNILLHSNISEGEFTIGISNIHKSVSELDTAIKESYWSTKVATIEKRDIQKYSQLGTWSMVVAHYGSKYMIRYMKDYLRPILREDSDLYRDLLNTLIVFVECEGNTKLASEELKIHENTFRYRMNKIREEIGGSENNMVFYENTSIAVKIYLLEELERLNK